MQVCDGRRLTQHGSSCVLAMHQGRPRTACQLEALRTTPFAGQLCAPWLPRGPSVGGCRCAGMATPSWQVAASEPQVQTASLPSSRWVQAHSSCPSLAPGRPGLQVSLLLRTHTSKCSLLCCASRSTTCPTLLPSSCTCSRGHQPVDDCMQQQHTPQPPHTAYLPEDSRQQTLSSSGGKHRVPLLPTSKGEHRDSRRKRASRWAEAAGKTQEQVWM